MNSIVLRIPPEREQRRIISKVDELLKICNTLKARIVESNDTQIRFADGLVDNAIS